MKNNKKKSEKELFEEEIKNWPNELQQEEKEILEGFDLIKEDANPKFTSIEEADKFYEAVPWEDYLEKWLK